MATKVQSDDLKKFAVYGTVVLAAAGAGYLVYKAVAPKPQKKKRSRKDKRGGATPSESAPTVEVVPEPAVAAASSSSSGSSEIEFIPFIDEEMGISFKYPRGWKLDKEMSTIILTTPGPENDPNKPHITISVDRSQFHALETFKNMQTVLLGYSGAHVQEHADTSLDGVPAYDMTFFRTINAEEDVPSMAGMIEMMFIGRTALWRDKQYLIQYFCSRDSFDEHKAAFYSLVDGLKILNKEVARRVDYNAIPHLQFTDRQHGLYLVVPAQFQFDNSTTPTGRIALFKLTPSPLEVMGELGPAAQGGLNMQNLQAIEEISIYAVPFVAGESSSGSSEEEDRITLFKETLGASIAAGEALTESGESTEVTIDGISGRQWSCKWQKKDGATFKYVYTAFVQPSTNTLFVVGSGAKEERFADFQLTSEATLNSITFHEHEEQDKLTYVHPMHKFAIDIPAEWRVMESLTLGAVVTLTRMQKNGEDDMQPLVCEVNVAVEDMDENMSTLQQVVDKQKFYATTAIGADRFLLDSDMTLAGRPGHKLAYKFSSPEITTELVNFHAITIRDRRSYAIQLCTTWECAQSPIVQGWRDELLSKFRLLD